MSFQSIIEGFLGVTQLATGVAASIQQRRAGEAEQQAFNATDFAHRCGVMDFGEINVFRSDACLLVSFIGEHGQVAVSVFTDPGAAKHTG